MTRTIRTIDAHVAGEPLRLIVDGVPRALGETMLQKREWFRKRQDRVRRALLHEPRGHRDMYGAALTEPVAPGSHAGVLFMHHEGYSTMCGHGIVGVVTIALERGLLVLPEATAEITLDTPAGTVRARPRWTAPGVSRVESVSFTNVPAFVLRAALPIRVRGRALAVDIAFGGAFYAIVDAEAAGVPLRTEAVADLRRIGLEIGEAVENAMSVAHPVAPDLKGVYGTIFTGPPNGPDVHLRNATVFADGQLDRSPCGTGTAAVMAVLDAMGLLETGRDFVYESLIGTTFRGRATARTLVGETPAIVPEIEGTAWITGEHTFLIDDEDPLKDGFTV